MSLEEFRSKHDMKFTAPRTLGRVHLSIQQKIDVVKFYKDENGRPAEAIKRFAHYRLKYGAAKNLFKKCKWEDILSMEGSKGLTKTFRSTKTSTYPVLEKILLKYTNAIREGGLPLSFNGIKSIALSPAQNYYEMLQYFDDLIRLGKNDTALTYKLRNLRIQFAKDHKPRQKQQRLSVVWACEESCEEQSESRMV